jgi:catechol 2,3-dioxygenase-like lactoylglutathione lyase family enzyme
MSWFGTPPAGLDLYHVGLVVPDVRAAMARYSDALGFTWSPVGDSTFDVLVDGRRTEARVAATYSMEGPPYLELVEELSGGIWAIGALGLQHVGFWADDLEGAITRFDAAGLPGRVRHLPQEGQPTMFSYHDGGAGLWWELVSPAFRPRLEARLQAGRNQP